MSIFKLLHGGLFVLFSLALEGRLLAQCDLYPIFLSDYQCNDNGTPSDPSDDTFTFNITMTNIGSSSGFLYNGVGISGSGNYDAVTTIGPISLSEVPANLGFRDSDNPNCVYSLYLDPGIDCTTPSCGVGSQLINYVCDDGGTPTDPTDDTFTVDLLVNGVGTNSSGWTASGFFSGTGLYDVPQTFGPFTIYTGVTGVEVVDNDDPECNDFATIFAPASCSNGCVFTNVAVLNVSCNDNGTPGNTNDDFVTVTLFPLGNNIGSFYTVTTNTGTLGNDTGNYNESTVFNIFDTSPASTVTLTITDSDDPTCTFTLDVEVPQDCGQASCEITNVTISELTCFTNGTSTTDDDVYTFLALVEGSNTSSGWTSNDPFNNFGDYNNLTLFGPFLIADGTLSITVTDNDDPTCTFLIEVTPPAPCSTPPPCSIMATANDVQCDDNGTPNDPTDDTFTFSLSVNGTSTGSGWTADDVNSSFGDYDNLNFLGPYPIAGGDLSFTVTDNDDPTCTTTVQVTAPAPCSVPPPCSITASVSAIECDDNGTPEDPTDDTFTFSLSVNGTSTGSGWTADDANSSFGNYGSVTTLGPYPISGGGLSFTVTDNDDPTCTTTVEVTAPAPCSVPPPCSIAATASAIECDDNGTPEDPTDDTFTFSLSVNGTSTGSGWTADDVNSSFGDYDNLNFLGPYAIAGGDLSFTVTDNDDPTCTTTVEVTAPAPCSVPPPCSITATASAIECDDNGTPEDPSDDTFTFSLSVNGTSTGSGWTADDVNSSFGDYDNLNFLGPYPIAGGDLSFTVTDNDDPTCTTTVEVTAPAPCSVPPPCSITASASAIECDDNGTPEDPTDDTFTFSLSVNGTSTGSGWTADDANSSFGDYGNITTLGPYPISGGDLSFTVTDNDDPTCTTTVEVTAPAPCSVPPPCSITASASAIECDDNGTPEDPSDDTFTFSLSVNGTSTGSGWTADDVNSSFGDYGNLNFLGPYAIAGGDLSFTVTDNDDPTCTTTVEVTAPVPCSVPPPCSITATASAIECDDNGTPNDPTDDTFTFSLLVEGTSTGSGWTADDVNSSFGDYDNLNFLGPYAIAGGDLSFTVTDNDDPICTTTVEVTAPAPCSVPPPCSIMATANDVQCDDNGTPEDPSDDTFTFSLLVNGTSTGSGWTADDVNSSFGDYDNLNFLGPYAIAGGDLSFTVTDNDDPTCTTTVQVTAPAPCSVPPPCSITASASAIECDDNGTPEDPSDDTFIFSLSVNGTSTGSGWTADDVNSSFGDYGNLNFLGPYPIAGGDLSFTVTDNDDPTCTTTVQVTAPAPCSVPPPCSITATANDVQCDDNGTPEDPSDDTFTFSLSVNGTSTGSGWTADDVNSSFGDYGNLNFLGPYAIAGGDLSFTVTDNDDPTCTTTVQVTAPAPCSVPPPCSITASASAIECDDNGTPEDPTDDTFTFSLSVNGTSTGSDWTADDVNSSFGDYDNLNFLGPYPIAGGDLSFTVTDNDDPTCTTTVEVTAPAPCSVLPPCSITATASAIECDDNGTPEDPSDDTFTFSLSVNWTSTGSGWTADDVNSSFGDYDNITTLGPYPISGGDLSFTITDNDDPTCTTTVEVTAPAPCSVLPPCSITATVSTIECDNNGTPEDPSDDTFTFSLSVNGTSTGSGWTADDVNSSFGDYGNLNFLGPYPIAGGNLSFTVTDNDDPTCTTTVEVTAPAPCSVPPPCSITASASAIECDDNGTPEDPTDDTFTFSLSVNGTSTGSGWTADDVNSSFGDYGNLNFLGPYPIAGGDLSFTVTDNDDPTCTTTVEVTAPAPCSVPPPCSIMATANDVQCDDNGTPEDPSDDTFTFSLSVNGTSTGSGWTADDVNSSFGDYDNLNFLGPYAIAGGDLSFTVTDNDDPTCTTTVEVTAPAPCSVPPPCSITASASAIECDDNGTPEDPSDDTFTFSLSVNGTSTGSGWTADDVNSSFGDYDNLNFLGPYAIAGGDLSFTVTDNDDPTCTTTVEVTAPAPCSVPPPCSITATASAIECDDNGTPEDPTDDTFTFSLSVNGTSTGSGWTADDVNSSFGDYDNLNFLGPYAIAGGDLSFTVTDNDDPTCTTTVEVTAPAPCSLCQVLVDAGEDTVIDCTTTSVLLTGSASEEGQYQWTGPDNLEINGQESILVTEPGTYFFTTFFAIDCQATDSVIVADNRDFPIALILADPTDEIDCIVSAIDLVASAQENATYTWDFGGDIIIAPQITVTTQGLYTLSVIDTLNGCSAQDTIVIEDFTEYPIINITPPNSLDCNTSTVTLDATNSQAGDNIVYQWLDESLSPIPNATGNTLAVTEPDVYYLQLTDTLNGCINVDTVNVTTDFNFPIVALADTVELSCEATQTTLSFTWLSDPLNTTIEWFSPEGNILAGGNTLEASVEGEGYYYLSVQNLANGCTTLDSVLVSTNTNVPALVAFDLIDELCEGEANGALSVTEVVGGEGPYEFTLNGTLTNTTGAFTNLAPGLANLTITDSNGCTLDTSFTVAPGAALDVSLPTQVILDFSEQGVLNAEVNVPDEDLLSVQWIPAEAVSCASCLETLITTNTSQNLTLVVTLENGCVATVQVQVIVNSRPQVFVPNAFSPNGDGSNDRFTLFANETVERIEDALIADRWGEIVFRQQDLSPNDLSLGWDGVFNGQPMNAGVYVYLFVVRFNDGRTEVFKGDVTLMR